MVEYYYDASKVGSFGAKSNKLPKEWWLHSRPYTLHKPVRKIFPTKPTLTSAPNIQYQADLMDLQNFKKENQGHAYVLIVIDVFSRQLFAYPLKNKLGSTVTKAFTKLFRAKHVPIYLQTDQGTEFFNNHMKKLLKKYKVTLFSVKSQFKASMAERVIRTIKARMWRYFTYKGNYKWLPALQELVSSYNDTIHSSIKTTPNEASQPEHWQRVWDLQEQKVKPSNKTKFQVDDYVRVSRWKGIFEKGFTSNFSEEIFQIASVDSRSFPVMYVLKDYDGKTIEGKFYTEELQKVAKPTLYAVERVIRRNANRRGESLVKFDDSPHYYYATDLQHI